MPFSRLGGRALVRRFSHAVCISAGLTLDSWSAPASTADRVGTAVDQNGHLQRTVGVGDRVGV